MELNINTKEEWNKMIDKIIEALDEQHAPMLHELDFTDWLERYKEWLDAGLKHRVQGDEYDSTQYLVEDERYDFETDWSDFLEDYTGNWEATFESHAGKRWLTYGDLWLDECEEYARNQIWTYLQDTLGIRGDAWEELVDTNDVHDVIEDYINEVVADYEPVYYDGSEGWKEIHEQWLAQQQLDMLIDTI